VHLIFSRLPWVFLEISSPKTFLFKALGGKLSDPDDSGKRFSQA
jgi:hypothetical protein